jgi:HEAT repeat protein
MFELLATCAEPPLRQRLLVSFRGRKEEEYRNVLMRTLQVDSSEQVRATAASVLGGWKHDAVVQGVLQNAAANDPSEKVKRTIAWTLRPTTGAPVPAAPGK